MNSNFNDKANFAIKLQLTDIQVSRLASSSSANIKLSKIQLLRVVQSGRFFGRLLGPLLKPYL